MSVGLTDEAGAAFTTTGTGPVVGFTGAAATAVWAGGALGATGIGAAFTTGN
jgi:hypothetical protein